MRPLLDTHAVIWAVSSPATLAPAARAVIEDPANDVFVSSASVWEITIEEALGKLTLPASIEEAIGGSSFDALPITHAHAVLAGRLPPHHRDLFDRMLVAQALIDGLTIVTRDATIPRYTAATIAA